MWRWIKTEMRRKRENTGSLDNVPRHGIYITKGSKSAAGFSVLQHIDTTNSVIVAKNHLHNKQCCPVYLQNNIWIWIAWDFPWIGNKKGLKRVFSPFFQQMVSEKKRITFWTYWLSISWDQTKYCTVYVLSFSVYLSFSIFLLPCYLYFFNIYNLLVFISIIK